jgi:membrane-bound metal-dependent hydrolase YbcI (DUF457 family)
VSWAAHQFETYAVQAHLPKRWRGRVSFLAIVVGDMIPDFVAKFWTYGFTINGHHYGAAVPYKFHRGWPGAGFSHAIMFGVAIAAAVWFITKNRAWVTGILIGLTAHVVVDINDSVGTMLLFPFSTLNFSLGTWKYAATVSGGKYLDAAAYYSSFGLVMDLVWLGIVLASWRVLTREYWRTQIVPADPKAWAWLGRRMPEPVLLAFYRSLFFYGVCRVIAWTAWAHLIASPPPAIAAVIHGPARHFPFDLHWDGPYWMEKVYLDRLPVVVVLAVAGACAVVMYFVVDYIIRRGIRADERAAAAAISSD